MSRTSRRTPARSSVSRRASGSLVDLIEPAGFLLSDRQFRRAGLDYLALAALRRYPSWRAYRADRETGRLLLLTTRGETVYTDFRFQPDDVLLLGRESAGVPEAVHAAVDARLRIPMLPGARSLNVAVAAAMVLGRGAAADRRTAAVLRLRCVRGVLKAFLGGEGRCVS